MVNPVRGVHARQRSWAYRIVPVATCLICLGSWNAQADPPPCAFRAEANAPRPAVHGTEYSGQGSVAAKAWDSFLGLVVTPRFPDGFTVYDAYGQ